LENVISQNDSIKDLAEDFHIETKSVDQQETEKAIQGVYDKLHSVAQAFAPQ